MREGAFRAYYPHTIGHHLGLDVHDCGDLSREERGRSAEFKLSAGMAITIEPGIYIQPDDLTVDENWRGIGIRIEDNILVTDDGYENLSAAAIK
ncbi:MAG: M24 family metallopeptidase [Lentisphaeraceae bacterium]|nr:M24 family metallopeptidase [Lentisphaeraceae bacterium]